MGSDFSSVNLHNQSLDTRLTSTSTSKSCPPISPPADPIQLAGASAPPLSGLTVRDATPHDFPAIAAMISHAYIHSPLERALYPGITPVAHRRHQMEKLVRWSQIPSTTMLVALDPSPELGADTLITGEQVVCFWIYTKRDGQRDVDEEGPSVLLPACTDKELLDKMRVQRAWMKEAVSKDVGPHIWLDFRLLSTTSSKHLESLYLVLGAMATRLSKTGDLGLPYYGEGLSTNIPWYQWNADTRGFLMERVGAVLDLPHGVTLELLMFAHQSGRVVDGVRWKPSGADGVAAGNTEMVG